MKMINKGIVVGFDNTEFTLLNLQRSVLAIKENLHSDHGSETV